MMQFSLINVLVIWFISQVLEFKRNLHSYGESVPFRSLVFHIH